MSAERVHVAGDCARRAVGKGVVDTKQGVMIHVGEKFELRREQTVMLVLLLQICEPFQDWRVRCWQEDGFMMAAEQVGAEHVRLGRETL